MASRLTFRSVAESGVAYQRQQRDRYADEPAPSAPHLEVKRAQVRAVSRRIAEHVILKYEWLGTMVNTSHHFGIFFGSYCAGVTCFGFTSTGGTNVHLPFALERMQVATLARGACVHWAPVGTNSKLVSYSCKLLAKASDARLVIAYADSDAGEIGTIYQACNWVYIGTGSPTTQLVAPNGRIYDQKLVSNLLTQHRLKGKVKWSDQRDALLVRGFTEQRTNPKHRYVCILDRSDAKLVARVEAMRKPYPKREPASEALRADAAAHQAEEGGSSPTPTLHRRPIGR